MWFIPVHAKQRDLDVVHTSSYQVAWSWCKYILLLWYFIFTFYIRLVLLPFGTVGSVWFVTVCYRRVRLLPFVTVGSDSHVHTRRKLLCPISSRNFINFNKISNIVRYLYGKPPYNNRKCGWQPRAQEAKTDSETPECTAPLSPDIACFRTIFPFIWGRLAPHVWSSIKIPYNIGNAAQIDDFMRTNGGQATYADKPIKSVQHAKPAKPAPHPGAPFLDKPSNPPRPTSTPASPHTPTRLPTPGQSNEIYKIKNDARPVFEMCFAGTK